jgi:hypothetical protein
MEMPDEKKSKNIALKDAKDIIDETTDEEDVNDDEIDLVTRKLRKFLKSKRSKRSDSSYDSSSKNTKTIYQHGDDKVARFQRALEKKKPIMLRSVLHVKVLVTLPLSVRIP